MNTLITSLLFSFFNTLVLVIVYWYLYRQYTERALKFWAISWLVYSVRFVFMLLIIHHGEHRALMAAHQLSSLISAAFLLCGMYLYLGRVMSLYWWPFFGAGFVWTVAASLAGFDFIIFALPVSLLIGAIFFRMGMGFIKAPSAGSMGGLITGVSFIIWGAHKLNYPFLRYYEGFAPWGYFISSIFIILIAVGMLISYFDKVRFRLMANEKSLDNALLDSIRREAQITLLLEGARTILENRGFSETAKFIFESCKKFTGASDGYVAILSRDGVRNTVVFHENGEVPQAEVPAVEQELCDRACLTREVVFDNSFPGDGAGAGSDGDGTGVENVLIAPLAVHGRSVGCIGLRNKKGGFDENDTQITRAFADLASISLMNSMSRDMIESSLHEKELLLKEVHHRVKNNMQIVSSLINLQAMKVTEEEHRMLYAETASRVRAMALVHEKLYMSENFARINFREYIRELAAGLMTSFNADPTRVKLEAGVENIEIGIDRAVPCAQIVNELISNALKYAFPGDRAGRIHILFGKNDDGGHRLVVADDGIGMPAHLDITSTKTLGLHLVAGLVKQLRGTMEIDRAGGTRITIEF